MGWPLYWSNILRISTLDRKAFASISAIRKPSWAMRFNVAAGSLRDIETSITQRASVLFADPRIRDDYIMPAIGARRGGDARIYAMAPIKGETPFIAGDFRPDSDEMSDTVSVRTNLELVSNDLKVLGPERDRRECYSDRIARAQNCREGCRKTKLGYGRPRPVMQELVAVVTLHQPSVDPQVPIAD